MTRVILISVLMMAPMITMAQTAEDDPCGAAGFQGLVGQTRDIADMLVLEQTKRVIRLALSSRRIMSCCGSTST